MTQNRAPICDRCGSKLMFYDRRVKRENGKRIVEWRYWCAECRETIKLKT